MTNVRSSPWLDARANLLITLLAERHGLTVSLDTARQDISDDLDHVARLMRIGRQAAKMYITDDTISAMADRIAVAVAEHRATNIPAPRAMAGPVVDLDEERWRRR